MLARQTQPPFAAASKRNPTLFFLKSCPTLDNKANECGSRGRRYWEMPEENAWVGEVLPPIAFLHRSSQNATSMISIVRDRFYSCHLFCLAIIRTQLWLGEISRVRKVATFCTNRLFKVADLRARHLEGANDLSLLVAVPVYMSTLALAFCCATAGRWICLSERRISNFERRAWSLVAYAKKNYTAK